MDSFRFCGRETVVESGIVGGGIRTGDGGLSGMSANSKSAEMGD